MGKHNLVDGSCMGVLCSVVVDMALHPSLALPPTADHRRTGRKLLFGAFPYPKVCKTKQKAVGLLWEVLGLCSTYSWA